MQFTQSKIVIVTLLFSSFLLNGNSQPVDIEKDQLLQRLIKKNSVKQSGNFLISTEESTQYPTTGYSTPGASTNVDLTTTERTTGASTTDSSTITSSTPDYTQESTPIRDSTTTRSTSEATTRRTTNSTTAVVITSTVELFPCVEQPDDSWIYANPEDCSSFYVCSNGNAYLYDCPSGLVFNPATHQCDFPSNVPECNNV